VHMDGRKNGFTQFKKYLNQVASEGFVVQRLVLNIAGYRLQMIVSEIQSKAVKDVAIRRIRVNIAASPSPLGWNQFVQHVVQMRGDLIGQSLDFLLPTGVITLHVEDVSIINSKRFQCLIAE
jgi:hypothetical protein